MNRHGGWVSVVICSYNRAPELERTLAGLTRQRFPRERFEIVVVDDGSTDDTRNVAARYGVVYQRHPVNRGIPHARNTGLHAARGDIVAFIDDDCIPEPDWLEQLIACYGDERVLGVGGAVHQRDGGSLTASYLYESGYGKPVLFDVDRDKGLLGQFRAYLRLRWRVLNPSSFERRAEAAELVGANVSFRRGRAIAVGGYDVNLQVLEDIDLSLRLRASHPHARLVYNPDAVVRHKYPSAFLPYLRKSYRWGGFLLYFQRKTGRPTPIHPFPLAWLVGNAVIGAAAPVLLLVSVPLLAYALYAHWTVLLLRRPKWRYALYPFMQLLIETSITFGVVRALAADAVSAKTLPAKRQIGR
jgi:glycosyltransferase involved in cell wall biosynthesis